MFRTEIHQNVLSQSLDNSVNVGESQPTSFHLGFHTYGGLRLYNKTDLEITSRYFYLQ
jgi:hypothetical protein